MSTWNDIIVSAPEELLLEVHTDQFMRPQPMQGGHRRSSYCFRGMADADWKLQTSLERHWKSPPSVEGPSLRAFGKYASSGTLSGGSEWERLAIAQHNGLPTRCLDWTSSPLIAAHFATAEREHYDKDGVIWCVDIACLRDEILPNRMAGTLDHNSAYVYDVPMLGNIWGKLSDFDEKGGEALLYFEPPSVDERIHNQYGLLSVMNGPEKSHDEFLSVASAGFPDFVRRIVINAEAKPAVRDVLDQNNITERMLFPGLPGLCDWLRRYYGPAN